MRPTSTYGPGRSVPRRAARLARTVSAAEPASGGAGTVLVAAVMRSSRGAVVGAGATARPSGERTGGHRGVRWTVPYGAVPRPVRDLPAAGAGAAGAAAARAAGAAAGARAAGARRGQFHRRGDQLLDLERHALQRGERVLANGHVASLRVHRSPAGRTAGGGGGKSSARIVGPVGRQHHPGRDPGRPQVGGGGVDEVGGHAGVPEGEERPFEAGSVAERGPAAVGLVGGRLPVGPGRA